MSFSLLALSLWIFAVAIAMFIMFHCTTIIASVVFSLAIAVVAIATLNSFGASPRRAFWRGLALGAGIYLFLVHGPWCDQNIGSHLITTQLLEKWEKSRPDEAREGHTFLVSEGNPFDTSSVRNGAMVFENVSRYYFVLAGQSFLALLLGSVLGVVCSTRSERGKAG